MALLTNAEREELLQKFEDDASSAWEEIGIGRQEVRAAINAVDQWIEDNQASFNAALPLAARTALSAKQKARLFFAVAKKRLENN